MGRAHDVPPAGVCPCCCPEVVWTHAGGWAASGRRADRDSTQGLPLAGARSASAPLPQSLGGRHSLQPPGTHGSPRGRRHHQTASAVSDTQHHGDLLAAPRAPLRQLAGARRSTHLVVAESEMFTGSPSSSCRSMTISSTVPPPRCEAGHAAFAAQRGSAGRQGPPAAPTRRSLRRQAGAEGQTEQPRG